jgi:group II intron reverse transcriptase/maturase
MQRAIVMLLEPIYEAEFRTCSFGFRPGKSAHDALEHLWKQSMGARGERPVRWMLDVDIKAFFDTLVHRHLRQLLDRRVRDGVVRRLIDKWLKAGVMDEGVLSYAEDGTPQGGVISPLLSNIYLHEVLDLWFEQDVQPRMKGRAFLVRYADDFVIGFEYEEDARRVQAVLPKRFARYGLTLHPEKTRLVPFTPPVRQIKQDKEAERRPPHPTGDPQSRSFDFLGFTHYWGRSRKGQPVIQRQTARKRLTRALGKLREWMRANRHEPVRTQWQTIKAKIRGHYAYYGIRGNGRGVSRFGYEARRAWFKWLNRRGGRKSLTWERFGQWLAEIFVWPEPCIYHRPYRA